MKRLIKPTVLAITLLITTQAGGAEKTDKPTRPARELTEPEVFEVSDKSVTFACYDEPGFVDLRHLITDYHTIWLLLAKAESQLVDFRHEVTVWKLRTTGLKTDNKAEKRRGDQFKALYTAEHTLRLGSEKRRDRVAWIPWGLMIAQGVLYAGIAVWGVGAR